MMFDIIIQSAKIVDGTGFPWFVADVGIKDGKIALVLVDMDRICDQSDFSTPDQPPLGIELIMVNGKIAMQAQKTTYVGAGNVLRCGQ